MVMNKELLDYFKGDELASTAWKEKYAHDGEVTPDDMHWRLAKEFARVEVKHPIDNIENDDNLSEYGSILKKEYDKLTEDGLTERYYNLFKDFKYIVPQGSIMSQLGSNSIGSLSNCYYLGSPEDSYGGIFEKDQQLVQLAKRRGGVGLDISTLRPNGTPTSNAAKSSTGAISFMHRFSNSTREVAQLGRRK